MQNDIQRCKFPESKPEITITRLSITLDVSVHLLTPAFKPGQENHKIRAWPSKNRVQGQSAQLKIFYKEVKIKGTLGM